MQLKWGEPVALKNVLHGPEKFVGIDPSLSCTGVSLVTSGSACTLRLEPKQLRGPNRLDWFYQHVRLLISSTAPDMVAIEGYAFGAQAQHHALGELGGVIRLALLHEAVPFVVAPPTVLKKFATGKGNADKAAVSKELYKRFAIDFDNNDEVDAAGLAVLAMAHAGRMGTVTKEQQLTLAKVEAFGSAR